MKAGSIFWKVFSGTVAVILITAFVVYLVVLPTIDQDLRHNAELRVGHEATLSAELCQRSYRPETTSFDLGALESVAGKLTDSRFTVVDGAGAVLFDSHELVSKMDNHLTRAELSRPGEPVTRFSRTMGQEMTYIALPVTFGDRVVAYSRVAISVEDRENRVEDLRGAIRNGALLAGLLSLVLAWFFARHVTRPIGEIAELVSEIGAHQTTRRLEIRKQDELGRLAKAVNKMADELQGKISQVEQDRAEREAIFSAMVDGLLAVDTHQNILFINQPARQLLGNLADEVKGVPVWELIRNRELLDVIEACLADKVSKFAESRITSTGSERIVDLAAVSMSLPGGKFHGCVLEMRDVTELRRLEALRRDFVSNVSHELKTPLTAMRGYTEALLEDADMPEELRRSFLEKAHANTERLTAIVSDLLSLSRLQSEEHELAFEVLDVNELAPAMLEDMRDLADSRRIRLELDRPDAGLEVRADAEALVMAASNLLSNAIRYSPEGETVRMSVRGDGDEVRIEVIDHGPGIPAKEQERIFERFYRLDKARSRKLGGTGLGLAIVKNVMTSHGGRVEIKSAPGEGSRFSLLLRRAKASGAPMLY